MATTTDDALAASKRLRRTDCTCLGRGTCSVPSHRLRLPLLFFSFPNVESLAL